ncbi:MAG: carbohydrate kinase [Bacteroidaceae bacterium]|nr:carbohydrate kinase [Bacteroidaceae bacterium]
MKKVIGIGETILDILFKDGKPVKAVPGGSTFNSMISLGRMGMNVSFISEVGNDKVGKMILDMLHDSGVETSSVCCFSDGKSPLSLAFLNEKNDAEYLFYKDYPNNRLEVDFPIINADDVVVYGSYFVLNPVLRSKTKSFLEYARERGAILYYDINFRKNHIDERVKLAEALIENLEFADIVRGSSEDFENLYRLNDATAVYKEKIKFYSPNFICTGGAGSVKLFTKGGEKEYTPNKVDVVSTVGAGDNFNAGVVYGILSSGITRDELYSMSQESWDKVMRCGLDFSSHACTSLDNYVSKEWAMEYKKSR